MILKTTYCAMCNKEFIKNDKNHIYCGNDRNKTGCSYKRSIIMQKKWKEKHPDKLKLYNSEYCKNNLEKFRIKNVKYYKNNPEKFRIKNAEYYQKNKAKLKLIN